MEETTEIMGQLIEGYKYLRQEKIVHGDIKPTKILIGFDGGYKLSVTKITKDALKVMKDAKVDTPVYQSP